MRKFRTLLAAIAAGAAIAAQACWFGDNNTSGLEDAYLAYLSGDVKHVEKGSGDNSYTIKNGQTVALPFTVFVKVSPHKHNGDTSEGDTSDGENSGKITKAVLQYAIVNGSGTETTAISSDTKLEWITVKEIDNPDWEMNFEDPVALFGRDCIDIPNVTEQKEVIIRLYLSDGTYSTGQLEDSTSGGDNNGNGFSNIQDSITVNGSTGGGSSGNSDSNFTYSDGWTAPFVWKVKVLPNASKTESGGSGTKPSRRPHR